MALPLPRVVADIEPGGGLVTARKGINALTSSGLQNQIDAAKARYAPITAQADAASKLAYASLMGPQFLAKLMGNEDILSNIDDPKKRNVLQMLLGAGTGQNALMNGLGANTANVANQGNVPNAIQDPVGNLFAKGINYFKNAWNFGDKSSPQSNNAFAQQPVLQSQVNQPMVGSSTQAPQQVDSIPEITAPQSDGSWVGNRAAYAGRVEEGKKAGELRAGDIKELNDTAFNANTMQGTLDELSGIVNSPEFRQIRQIPIAGQHEIGWYAKFGTPAQKRMIGNFLSEQGQVVVNAAGQFKGAFRAGEQGLINTMKVNPSDMPEVASGKIQGMSILNQMLAQRSALTARLMEDQHLSKGKAMEIADKQVNGKKIREHLDKSIMITVRNKKTGDKKTISLLEARKLGVPNV